jgi:DNA helicase-2/ATP-dependent DNA helicase PcrA
MPDAALLAQAGDGPEPTIDGYDDEPAEAAAVTRRIAALAAGGVPLREMAVLYRVNAQSEVYEQALAQAEIPYVVRGGERFFERREVREAIVRLRGALRSANPPEPAPLPETVAELVQLSPLPPSGRAARDAWESLRAIVGLAQELAGMTLEEFVEELARRAEAQHAPPVDGVTLASLHAAKGLEWDAVFLVGLADGTLPITHATTPEQVEEERRLLYVGITRARRHLGLSWAASRSAGGRRGRKASRFLTPLLPPRAGRSKSDAKPRPKDGGRSEDPVVARLRAWRLERSRDDGVPAYVVFDNRTLEAIAQRRPANRSELASVPGVGPKKLEQYADEVLAVLHP